jgi:succinyl-diaminopimelate desuccinylase
MTPRTLEPRPHEVWSEASHCILSSVSGGSTTRKKILPPVVSLARDLIRIPSITPHDNGCQALIASRLEPLGFHCEEMNFENVSNLWCVHHGRKTPTIPRAPVSLVFAGHTDVVPPGPLDQWALPPFDGAIKDGILYGRGAADMKGGIACFMVACERFLKRYPDYGGSIGLLITSDEEGVAEHGTKLVIEKLQQRGEVMDFCLVGEPTSKNFCGDTIKVGRRGSLGGKLTVLGKQGHIAYPHLADNPLHASLGALKDLVDMEWDDGNDNFPPTSFQISNINGGTGATNVIPGHKTIHFNFRYSPETTDDMIKQRVKAVLQKHQLGYVLEWEEPAYPYETKDREFAEVARESIRSISGHDAHICTSGGTSDGRFIAKTGAQVVELGLTNDSIHQVDERVPTKDLEILADIYEDILQRILFGGNSGEFAEMRETS